MTIPAGTHVESTSLNILAAIKLSEPLLMQGALAPAARWSEKVVEKLAQKSLSCCIGNSSFTRLPTFAGVVLTLSAHRWLSLQTYNKAPTLMILSVSDLHCMWEIGRGTSQRKELA